MQKYTDVVTSVRSGAAKPDARVTVKTYPAGVVATIYSDDGVTTQDNPITTDSNGEFYFYAADGEYTLTVSGTGITERTIGPIILHDPTDADDYMLATDVSFTPSGIATTAHRASRTVNAKLSEVEVSVNDAEGSTDTEKVNRAIAAVSENGGGKVRVPEGSYSWLSVVGKSNVELYLDAGAVVTKDAGGAATHIVDAQGTLGTGVDLASNAAIGEKTVSADASTGLAEDGWVVIRDDNYVSTTVGRNQEIAQIASISGSGPYTVTLKNRLIGAYTTASNAQIIPLTPVENFRINGTGKFVLESGTDGGGLYFDLTVGCHVGPVTVSGADDTGAITFERSYNFTMDNPKTIDGQNTSTSGKGYGIAIGESSHHGKINFPHAENVRENMLTNRTRFVTILESSTRNCASTGWNTHGSGNQYITFLHPKSDGDASAGIAVGFSTHTAADKDIWIINPEITNALDHGISVTAPNAKENERVYIVSPKIRNVGLSGTATRYGIVMQECLGGGVFDPMIDGNNATNVTSGVFRISCTEVHVHGGKIENIANGYGVQANTVTRCHTRDVTFEGISSNNVYYLGTNSGCRVTGCFADDTVANIDSATRSYDNSWNVPEVTTTAVGNVGTGEDDLISRTLAANTLDINGKGVRITAWGSKGNTANAKTLKLYFGTTAILTHSLGTSALGNWKIEALVFRTSSNAQDYIADLTGTDTDQERGVMTETDTAAITVKCTGEATDNNDINHEGLLIEVLR
jgi:hypothetical protein